MKKNEVYSIKCKNNGHVCLEQKSHLKCYIYLGYKIQICFNHCNKYTLHIHRALMHSFW